MKFKVVAAASLCVAIHIPCEGFGARPNTVSPFRRDDWRKATRSKPQTSALHSSQDDKEEDPVLPDADWRAFRAQLVKHERKAHQGAELAPESIPVATKLGTDKSQEKAASQKVDSPASWAFDAGDSLEQGTVLLHHPPNNPLENPRFALQDQYLHKSVILLLQYVDCGSDRNCPPVQGVLLNRPTDFSLPTPDSNDDAQWDIWYGGQDHGLHSDAPKLFCLHSLGHIPEAVQVSRQVIPGIYFVTIQEAHNLVYDGHATPREFWTFAGIVQWDRPQELLDEVHAHMWHAVSTDSETIRKGLRILTAGGDPRDAGTRTWSMLRTMIGHHWAPPTEPRLDDLMLQQWAQRHLLFDEIPEAFEVSMFEEQDELMEDLKSAKQMYHLEYDDSPMYEMLEFEEEDILMGDSLVGRLVRACSSTYDEEGPPFLLDNQEFHRSIILITQDNSELSVGLLLNHPSPQNLDLDFIHDRAFFQRRTFHVPVRYGGPLELIPYEDEDDNEKNEEDSKKIEEETPIVLLHMSQRMRIAGIGEPISYEMGCELYVWKCTETEAKFAIAQQLAVPSDFMAIRGVCIWPKDGDSDGIQGEIAKGLFETVPQSLTGQVWKALLRQTRLSAASLNANLHLADIAWRAGSYIKDSPVKGSEDDEETDGLQVSLPALCQEALKMWIRTYLLGPEEESGLSP